LARQKGKKVVKKKKVRVAFDEGMAFVHSSFNNTIVCVTDMTGNVLAWSSGGKIGYKGSKKSTPFAAQLAAGEVGKASLEIGINKVNVVVKGPGGGREAALRALNGAGLKILSIKDATPLPHNGCRPPKQRRI